MENIQDYLVVGIIVLLAGGYLYFRIKNQIQKGKCAGCSEYGACSKEYKVPIEKLK